MNKFERLCAIVFIVLSILTMITSLVYYQNPSSLIILAGELSVNLLPAYLISFSINFAHKKIKRDWIYLIAIIILLAFAYWYILNIISKFMFGVFITFQGVLFFLTYLTILGRIIFFLSIILGLTLPSSLLYYFLFKKNIKVHSRKKRFFIIAFFLALMIITALVLSPHNLERTSPLTNYISYLLRSLTVLPEQIETITPSLPSKPVLETNFTLNSPNIIIILIDSLSADSLPSYGYGRNITPNIDSLAKNGIIFNNTYCTAVQSEYSQTAFLSARYTLKSKYRDFFTNEGFPRQFIWDILKPEGYKTAYISSNDDDWLNMIGYFNTTNLDVYSYSLSDGKYDYGSGNARNDYDNETLSKAINWLNNNSGNPFFLYLNFQATHFPYEYPEGNSLLVPDENSLLTIHNYIPAEDINSTLNRYDNALHYIDEQIGNLTSYLAEKNLTNNTIILLTADHGEGMPIFNDSKSWSNLYEDRIRHGFNLYDNTLRVPLILFIPNITSQVIQDRVKQIDIIPTLLKKLNFNTSEVFQGKEMIKNSDIFVFAQNQKFLIALIKDDLKYIIDLKEFTEEAYNLTVDPEERINLLQFPENVKKLEPYKNRLLTWYYCQLDYYKERYKTNSTIEC